MLNFGEKKNILTLVLSEKKFLNEAKNHNPPFKLNGRSLKDQSFPFIWHVFTQIKRLLQPRFSTTNTCLQDYVGFK